MHLPSRLTKSLTYPPTYLLADIPTYSPMTIASLQRQRVFKIPIKIDVQNHHLEDKSEGQRKAKKHTQLTQTKERRELVPPPQEPKKRES